MRVLFLALLALALGACATRGKVAPPPAASSAEVPSSPEPDAAGGVPSERKPSNKSCTDAYEALAALQCPPLEGRDWIAGKCATDDSKVVTCLKNAKNCGASRDCGGL